MPQENLDVSRKSAEAFVRGDWDVLAASFDPNIFLRLDLRWPEPSFSGREAAVNFLKMAYEVLGRDDRIETIEEVRDLGDRVLVRFDVRAQGEHSGLSGNLRWTQIDTIRNGQIIFIEYFLDHADALKAVCLE